jgi:hypothetical protein
VNELCNNEFALAHQHFIEMQDVHIGEQHFMDINPSIYEIVGLDVHIQTHDNGIRSDVTSSHPRSKYFGDVDSWCKPALTIQDLVPKEINCCTGFCDLPLMLSFVSVVCGGDLTTMTCTSSMLTWLEEWIICCEFVWGRTLLRFLQKNTTAENKHSKMFLRQN